MLHSEEQWLGLADAFQSAAVSGTGWYAALDGLAKATGSQHGQLINIGADERKTGILQAAYGMTGAESDIAIQLCAGKTPETIAASRKVAVGKVRAQIKTLLAKADVKRQIELVARLNQL